MRETRRVSSLRRWERKGEQRREEDAPLSASPKTNQTGARLTNQRHPSATDAQLVREAGARTVDADAVDAVG
ncbi:hypothetical protein K0M31_009630 [Melipona bicolor]|uniref:Uncharacterized protein n=1 Tax=Melipona bicolor TaxID=60889 RepID=A0AA40FNF9_9HYME|nr:hypothetical protein K0M31_009630 [Melipona bicolor]